MLKHKDCGGLIEADPSKLYDYEQEDGTVEKVPSLKCSLCDIEVFGDDQIQEDFEVSPRSMLDRRYDEIDSGHVTLIPGEEAFTRLRANIEGKQED